MFKNDKTTKINRRHAKIRARVSGTADRPRLAISKSNRNIIAQLIDDDKNETLGYVWTKLEKGDSLKDRSISAGKSIAAIAKDKKITKVVFDRGGYKYIGNIKLLADAAREGGLEF
jgi:large subunit ribosomal protein L18